MSAITQLGARLIGATLVAKFVIPVLAVSLFFAWLSGVVVYQSSVGESHHLIDRRVSLVQSAVSELAELAYSPDDFSHFLRNIQAIGQSSFIAVIADEPATVIASTDRTIVNSPVAGLSLEQFGSDLQEVLVNQRPFVRDKLFILPLNRSGERAQPQIRRGAVVIQFVGGETSYYRSRAAVQIGILFLAMSVIITTLVYVIYHRFISVPVQLMDQHLRSLKLGEDRHKLPLMYRDEIGLFGYSIQTALDRFEDEERRNAALLNSTTVGIVTVSETGIIVYANLAVAKLMQPESSAPMEGTRLATIFGEQGEVTALFREYLAEWSPDFVCEPRILTIERESDEPLRVIGQIKPLALADRRVFVLSLTELASEESAPADNLSNLSEPPLARNFPIRASEIENVEAEKITEEESDAESDEITVQFDEDEDQYQYALDDVSEADEAGEGSGIAAAFSDKNDSDETIQNPLDDDDFKLDVDSSLPDLNVDDEYTALDDNEPEELTAEEIQVALQELEQQYSPEQVFDVRQTFKSFAPDFAGMVRPFHLEFRHDVRLTVPSFLAGNLEGIKRTIELILPLSAIEYGKARGIVLEVKIGEKQGDLVALRFYFAQLNGRRSEGDSDPSLLTYDTVLNAGSPSGGIPNIDKELLLSEAQYWAEQLGGELIVQTRLDRGNIYELIVPCRVASLEEFREQEALREYDFDEARERLLAEAQRQKSERIAAERARARAAAAVKAATSIIAPPKEQTKSLFTSSSAIAEQQKPNKELPSYPDELIVPSVAKELLGDGGLETSDGVEIFKRGSHKWAEMMSESLGATVPATAALDAEAQRIKPPTVEELLSSTSVTPTAKARPAPTKGGKGKKPSPSISKDTVSLSREHLNLVAESLPQKVEGRARKAPLLQSGESEANKETKTATPTSTQKRTEGARSFSRSRVLIAVGPEATASQPESLEDAGFDVTTARSGKELLVLMESRLFDVLILDVEFPDVQALETAKQIRTKERLSGGRVPIIALVKQANAGRYNKKHPEIDEFVTKPATEEQLIKKVQQLCRG